jgi:predicted ArsR family transcriptional regulator
MSLLSPERVQLPVGRTNLMLGVCLPFTMSETGPTPRTRRTMELHTQAELRAVSNLTRHLIIERLRDGEASTNGIANELQINKGSASYHLRLLERAGIVAVTRTKKVRGVYERFYTMTAERLVFPDPLPGAAASVLQKVIGDINSVPPSSEQIVARRRERIGAARYDEFYARLVDLLEEFNADGDDNAKSTQLVVVLFRDGRPPVLPDD